jgi:hypothetical protein
MSHFADTMNTNFASSSSPSVYNDLSLSPRDPEVSDHFSGENPDLAPNDPRLARVDSLQSLAEEDFYKEVKAACCNRRLIVLVGMSLMFVGAAVLAVVATAGRGWHWINPFDVSPLASSNSNNNTSMDNPTLDHPLSQACRPTRDHTERRQSCSDECAKYECCSAPADSCAATQKEDCVVYWDMCDSELMTQPNDDNNAGPKNDEEPTGANSTSDAVDKGASAVTIRPANLDALCTKTSLETSEGRAQCENACRDHMCCFSLSALEGDGNSCADDPDHCDAYRPCTNLIMEEAEDILEGIEAQEAGDDNDVMMEAQVEDEEGPLDDTEMEEVETELEEGELDAEEAEAVMKEVEEEEQNEGSVQGYKEIGNG